MLPISWLKFQRVPADSVVLQTIGYECKISEIEHEPPKSSLVAPTTDLTSRMNDLEKRMKECCDSITKSEGVLQDQV